jgi:hypothetical protein
MLARDSCPGGRERFPESTMSLARRLSLVLLLAVSAPLAACSSDPSYESAASGPSASPEAGSSGSTWDESTPVRGDIQVAWKNLDPTNPPAAVGLVNESSETGQKLKTGRATSSQVRVLTDRQMGGLLAQLEKVGFFQYATEGLSLDNVPSVPGRKGVVVVTRDGRSVGLLMTTNLGTSPVPKAYSDAKNMVIYVHGQVQGFEAKASIGESDERIFSAPKPTLRRP